MNNFSYNGLNYISSDQFPNQNFELHDGVEGDRLTIWISQSISPVSYTSSATFTTFLSARLPRWAYKSGVVMGDRNGWSWIHNGIGSEV